MDEANVILISNVDYTLCLNLGVDDKVSRKKGTKIYLTKKEEEYVRFNYQDSLKKGVFYFEKDGETELDEATVNNTKMTEEDKQVFFKTNTNKAKAQIRKMNDIDLVDELIEYANDNEIEGKIVDALADRYNELGE